MPTQASRKHEIVNWLRDNGVDVDETLLKVELLKLLTKKTPKRYVIEEMAVEYGHTVLRIPPYHCHYNPIELIWAQIKGHAARNNTYPPFSANKMLGLLENACANVTPENWANVVEKTKKIILADWDRDVEFDLHTHELITNVTGDTSDDDDYSSLGQSDN